MITKAYLSNIAPGWSMHRQKELLAAHVPGWPNIPIYADVLSPAKRQAHSPTSLTRRAELLRETTRLEIEAIVVASLACIAWEQYDFLDCVAAACARGATIVALDTGRRIRPNASPAEIVEAAKEFMTKRRAAKGGGTPGYLVSAQKRSAEKEEAAERIRPRWEQSTKLYPTNPLLAEAKLCRNTANQYLGKRPVAQQKYRDRMARADRDRRRQERVDAQEQLA